jgi:hypothetical protein
MKKKVNREVAVSIVLNLIPLFGLIFLEWSAFIVMFIYMMEVLVGVLINAVELIVYNIKKPISHIIFGLSFLSFPYFLYFFGFFFPVTVFLFNVPLPEYATYWDVYEFFIIFKQSFIQVYLVVVVILINEVYAFFRNFIGTGHYKEGQQIPDYDQRGKMAKYDPLGVPLGKFVFLLVIVWVGGMIRVLSENIFPVMIVLVLGKSIADIKMIKYINSKRID